MFCPNCGAENADSSNNCNKCGFRLKASDAGPKFKGTMLMDASTLPVGDTQAGEQALNALAGNALAGNALAGNALAGNRSAPKTPAPSAPGPARPRVSARSKLHGTMLGVAPPSAGAIVPPAEQPVPRPVHPEPAPVNPAGQTLVAGGSVGTAQAPAQPAATAQRSPGFGDSTQVSGAQSSAAATSARAFGGTQVMSAVAPSAGSEAHGTAPTALSPALPAPAAASARANVSPDSFGDPVPSTAPQPSFPDPGLLVTGPMSAFEPRPAGGDRPIQESLELPRTKPLGALGIFLTIITLGLYLVFRKKD